MNAPRTVGGRRARRVRTLATGVALAVCAALALGACSAPAVAPAVPSAASPVATSGVAVVRATPGAGLDCARSGARTVRFTVDGVARSALLHVPATARGRRVPLVVGFPGRGESAALLRTYSGLDALDAVVVIAEGLPGTGGKSSWQGTPYSTSGTDDLDFAAALLRWAQRSGCVDPNRIALTGKSDGGGFAELAACDRALRVSVLLTASAAFYARSTPCRFARPVTLVTLHGTADAVVPIDGSAKRQLRSEAAVDAQLARLDGCTTHRATTTSASVTTTWTGCRQDVHVVQYRLRGDGHTWPGATSPSGPGAVSRISATALLASALRLPRP